MVTTPDLGTVTIGELIARVNAEDLALIANPRWGAWSYDSEMYLTLRDEDDRELYEIHLPRCTTSAAMLDIVMQVSLKTWCRPQYLADLLAALQWLLHPQSTLCSWGAERGPIDVRATLAHRFEMPLLIALATTDPTTQ